LAVWTDFSRTCDKIFAIMIPKEGVQPQPQPQPEPVMNRRQFVTGIFLVGAGFGELVVAGYTNGINSRQKAEQGARAYLEIKALGTPAEPDPQAVAEAQQLQASLNPLHETTPELEEKKQQARDALKQRDAFAQAWQQRKSKIRSTEGPSELEETVNDGVGLKGVVTATFGALKMAKAKSDYDQARYDQEMKKRYPSHYRSPEDPA
jgi:hypothetical protein